MGMTSSESSALAAAKGVEEEVGGRRSCTALPVVPTSDR